MDYHRQNNVDIRIVRIFNTYGPRMLMNDGRVVSNFIVQALKGDDITIYGDGSQTRSFCYVDDLIEGFVRMMNQDKIIGPVNIGNPGEFTMLELAKEVPRARLSINRFRATIRRCAARILTLPSLLLAGNRLSRCARALRRRLSTSRNCLRGSFPIVYKSISLD